MNIEMELCKKYLFEALRIPEPMKIWEWCEKKEMKVPPESPLANTSYNPDVMPYWKEVLECFTENSVERVTVIKPAQIGFTFLIDQSAYYFATHDKSNVLCAFPDDQVAKRFSKQKLQPFIRCQPNIHNIFSEKISSLELMNFSNNHIAITGLNKSTAMTMNTYKTVFLDEMSNIAVSVAGTLGDPILLAEGRTQTFRGQSTVVCGGTLILEGGILEREFAISSQKYYKMPCPKCGYMQAFLFRDLDEENYKWLKYDVNKQNAVIKGTEYILCQNGDCNHKITNAERLNMIRHKDAKWVATIPEQESHQGYYINSLYSPFQSLFDIANAHSKALLMNDENIRQAFTNDHEARGWKDVDMSLDKLHDSVKVSPFEIPKDVIFLTMGIDTQRGKDDENYLAYEIIGWGERMQSFGIEYGKIYGDLNDLQIVKNQFS